MGDSGVDDLNDSFLQRRRPIEFTELLDSARNGRWHLAIIGLRISGYSSDSVTIACNNDSISLELRLIHHQPLEVYTR